MQASPPVLIASGEPVTVSTADTLPAPRFCTNAWLAAKIRAERSRFSPRIGRSRAFEFAVVGFDDVVRILLDDVPRASDELIEHTCVDRCPVGGDLDGHWANLASLSSE